MRYGVLGTAVEDRPVEMVSISVMEATINADVTTSRATLYDVGVAAVNSAGTGVYYSFNTQQIGQSKLYSIVVFKEE